MTTLANAKQLNPKQITKSGIMVGLGETFDEVVETMRDLRSVDVDILTVGQYLQPTKQHAPIVRYYTPEEFVELRRTGLEMGFRWSSLHRSCAAVTMRAAGRELVVE